MKVTIPSKTVEACDICADTGKSLTKCVVCQKDYCHTCEAIMFGCIHQPDVCKECGNVERVKATVDRFADPMLKVLRQRNTALRRIKINP